MQRRRYSQYLQRLAIQLRKHTAANRKRTFFIISLLLLQSPVQSYGQERWFQIEVSIFSNESITGRSEETWLPGSTDLDFPAGMSRLKQLQDILLTEKLILASSEEQQPLSDDELARQLITGVGPEPATSGPGFRFYDFQRDAFLQLPDSASDFRQTNRALRQSPEHRLLYHGLWRQPVRQAEQALPLYVSGGEVTGGQPELAGSITIRFNENEDRVVIDADIWLSEFDSSAQDSGNWRLPSVPQDVLEPLQKIFTENSGGFRTDSLSAPSRVYHMQQSREMRSNEFHYLDHPALGIVIMVEPYQVPLLPLSDGLPPIEPAQ